MNNIIPVESQSIQNKIYTIQDTLPKEWAKSLPIKEELQEKLKVGIDA